MRHFIVNRPTPVLVGLALCCLSSTKAIGAVEDAKGSAVSSSAKAVLDFTKDVRPILEKRCYECHGSQKQKSGLRLDRKSSALRGGDSGHLHSTDTAQTPITAWKSEAARY